MKMRNRPTQTMNLPTAIPIRTECPPGTCVCGRDALLASDTAMRWLRRAFAEIVIVQPDQAKRRVRFILDDRQYQMRANLVAGAYWRITQPRFGEWHRPVEQLIKGSDQLRRSVNEGQNPGV